MPVPRKKKSRARRDNRRSHIHLARSQVQKCPRCGEPKMSHRVCVHCGYYRDIEVIRMEEAK
jgi:large subunit ribosomal protein L32